MPSFLMWQYKNRNEGVFHTADSELARTKMLGKGYVDITGQQVWTVPYPISKGKQPAPVVPESPAQTIPEEVTPA